MRLLATCTLQIAFTNIGTLVFNLSQTNSTVYTFMPLITQNLSNLNASVKVTQDTLANWRNVNADGNYSVINVTNYIYLNGTNLTIFNAQVASNISGVNATVAGLSQAASNISGLNATIGNLQTADGVITANITNLNASLQIAFTNIGTLVFNLSQTNSTVYTFMPLITQNLSNLNASVKVTQDTLANWRNVTADGNYSVINVTNYIYLNGTNLTIFNAQVSSNISGINTSITAVQTGQSGLTANLSNVNASVVALTQTASNISGINATITTLQTIDGVLTANLTNLNASVKVTQDTLANWRNVTGDGNYSVINVTNYIYLNGTNLTIFNAQVASNISGVNATV